MIKLLLIIEQVLFYLMYFKLYLETEQVLGDIDMALDGIDNIIKGS
jgi:hypothetical protein